MKKSIIFILIYSCFYNLYSQSNLRFFSRNTINANQGNDANFICIESNANYYVVGGNDYCSLLRKYDEYGTQKQVLAFDTLFNKLYTIVSDLRHSKIEKIGSYFYYATYKSYGSQYHFTPCMVRIDTAGNKQVWDYTFNNPTQLLYYDQLQNHYIYAQGETNRDTANPNYMVSTGVIMQLDTSGAELWRYNYTPSGTYRNAPAGILATPDSGCVALFYIGPWPAYSIARLIKLDKNGQLQWQKNLPIPQGINIMEMFDYNVIDKSVVLGYETHFYSNIYLPYNICKMDSNMIEIWNLRAGLYDSTKVRDPFSANATDSVYTYISRSFFKLTKGHQDGYFGYGNYYRKGYTCYITKDGVKKWEAIYDSIIHGSVKVGAGLYGDYYFASAIKVDNGYVLTGSCPDSTLNMVGFLMKIDSLGCLTPDSCETRLISSITYYSPEQLRFSLYPNPATTTLHLTIEENKKYEVVFYNLMGQKIHNQQIENDTEIDVRDWQQGIYFYQLLDNGKSVGSGKVMKE